MVKRVIKEGFKHGTAMYALNPETAKEIPLNFIDLALHIALTANDNQHRLGYPRAKMAGFLAECVEKGYGHKKIVYFEDMGELYKDLGKTFEKYYRNLWKKRKYIDIICELPQLEKENITTLEDFPFVRSDP